MLSSLLLCTFAMIKNKSIVHGGYMENKKVEQIFNPFRIIQKNNCKLSNYALYSCHPYYNSIGNNESINFSDFMIPNISQLLEDFSLYGKLLYNNVNNINLTPYLMKVKNSEGDSEFVEIISISTPKYFTNANVEKYIKEISHIIIPLFEKYGFPYPPYESENEETHACLTYMLFPDIEKFTHQLIIFHFIYSFNSIYNLIYNNKLNSYFDKIKKMADDIEKEDFDDKMTDYYINILKPNINKFNEILTILFNTSEEKIELNLENPTGNISLKKYNPKNFTKSLEELYKKYINLVNSYSYQFLEDNSYKIYTDINLEENCLFYSSENLFCLVWHTFINSLLTHKSSNKIHYCEICNCILFQTGTKKPTRCAQHMNIGKQAKTDNKKKKMSQEIINLTKNHKIYDESINKYITNAKIRLKKPSLFRGISVEKLEKILDRVKEYIKDNQK